MRQRIRVIGIVKRGEDLLFLKRVSGRSIELPKYELPTGKIQFGEQPEEALARAFFEESGVHSQELKLMDVVSFTYLEGANQIGNLYIIYDIKIAEDAKLKVEGLRYSSYKWVRPDDLAGLALDDASSSVLRIAHESGKIRVNISSARAVANSATVWVDGSSRGNPGPAGVGYYIVGADGVLLKKGGEFIGFNTSRVAEYYGLKEGLEQAVGLGLKQIRIISDSLMMVNQINGVYQVKNNDLRVLYSDAQKLLSQFENWDITHVIREENTNADREANRVIDEWEKTGQ